MVAVSTTSDQGSVNSSPYGIGSPAVTGISPASGPTAGGTSVTITGVSLAGTTSVRFGTSERDQRRRRQLDADHRHLSRAVSGTVDVTATTPAGTSGTSAADQFTYHAGPGGHGRQPHRRTAGGRKHGSRSPGSGSSSSATAVKFGTATAYDNQDRHRHEASRQPPPPAAPEPSTSRSPPALGTSPTSTADLIHLPRHPHRHGQSTRPPDRPGGGTAVTITGTNFAGTPTVKFGANVANNVYRRHLLADHRDLSRRHPPERST